jgi:glycosyltransferase involved in cell wall biosynthesis
VKHVALVCEPPDGGAAEHVAHLARGLHQHGYEPTLFVPPEFKHKIGRVNTLAFRRDYKHPHEDARSLGQLTRRLGPFDLVHAHSAKAGVIGRVAAKLARKPVIYTPHGFPFVGEMSDARRRFGKATEAALAPATDAIIAVCEFERDLGKHLRTRIEVVHNGCAPCPDIASALTISGGPVVGTVSTLRRAKRIDVLIDAMPAVLEAVPETRFVITGEGPEEADLRAQAKRLGVEPLFLPFRPPSTQYLKGLDVYVLSSGWEAFPIGPLEALACGVPQVVTDVGGTSESVTPETGIVVAPHDPPALARAIIDLLRDEPRRQAMSAASRARHAAHFTVDQMVAKTATVYDTVLKGARPL